MPLELTQIKCILEAAIFTAESPLSIDRLLQLFTEEEQLTGKALREILKMMIQDYQTRGVRLHETASGYRFEAQPELTLWLQRLQEDRKARYSRAFLETLALIVYRQPITRGEIEEIRGVTISSQIMKTLLEREWIQVIGYKETPGRPALFGTTKVFLDDFGLKSLSELPLLPEQQEDAQLEQLTIALESL